ncbi:MAG: GNAT family N-acetyltransferase [Gemmatimonadaceae bacterium]|nr:GNAT family N-acetyltransferase [Gemmatimonadaceae bacterium]
MSATTLPTTPVVTRAVASDVPQLVALNNQFSADGLTLPRTEAFVFEHLQDYQVIRGPDGDVIGCVCVDEYSPSVAELVSLAVAPAAQGKGYGKLLIRAAERLARKRGYPELFAISLADTLFLAMGFEESHIARYPEKINRYKAISKSELSIGKKFCFTRRLG